jgi:hypothetical protein
MEGNFSDVPVDLWENKKRFPRFTFYIDGEPFSVHGLNANTLTLIMRVTKKVEMRAQELNFKSKKDDETLTWDDFVTKEVQPSFDGEFDVLLP